MSDDKVFYASMIFMMTLIFMWAFRTCSSQDYQNCLEATKSAEQCAKVKP